MVFVKSNVLPHTLKLGGISLQTLLDQIAFDGLDMADVLNVVNAFKHTSALSKVATKTASSGKFPNPGFRLDIMSYFPLFRVSN